MGSQVKIQINHSPQAFLTLSLLTTFLLNQALGEIIDFSLPKCKNSLMGDGVELPRAFISVQDVKNNTFQTLPVKLTQNQFVCEGEKGRRASLQVYLDDSNVENISEVVTFFKSGYLLHDKIYFSREEFCLQSILKKSSSEFKLSLEICEPKCSSTKNHACVQKCCEPGKVWDLEHYDQGSGKLKCMPSGQKSWSPFLYLNKYDKMDETEAAKVTVRYMNAHPKHFCDGGFFLMTLKDFEGIEASPFRVLKSGKVVMKVGRTSWETLPSSVYCVDGAMNFLEKDEHVDDAEEETYTMTGAKYSGNESDTVMLVCTEYLEDPNTALDGTSNLLYVVAMIFASVFLLMTAVVYAVLWKNKNVHGWTFLGYVVSLLLTFVFLSTAHLMSSGEHDCTFVGVACHFFFLSTFSWLTALNFDIYWTFRSLNPNPGRQKEIMRFLCYSVFAVGLPTIIVSVGLVLDEIYGDDPESEVIVPRYGVSRCTMDRTADLPYLFGPISVLLACNLILFFITLYYIYKSQKLTKLSGMKSNMLKHKIRFFGKLFILAGVTWIFEVISWACSDPNKPVHWIWKFLDLVNILQAVAIFAVFVCNRKTLKELSEKFRFFKRFHSILEKASGVTANSAKRPSNTHMSSIFDAPGLDTIELS